MDEKKLRVKKTKLSHICIGELRETKNHKTTSKQYFLCVLILVLF